MAESSLAQNTNIDKMEEKNSEEDDIDTPDGFKKSLKKAFKNFLCTSGISEDIPDKVSIENKPKPHPKESHPPQNMASDFSSDEYDFTHPKRGLALIINNEDFSRSKEFGDRPGSSYDASSLYHSFKSMGFDVLLFNDLPAWKMVEVLRAAIKEYDHSQADCFACSVLTHGDQTWSDKEYERMGTTVRLDLLFGTDGKALATKAMVEMFNDKGCPGLRNKPRLFFLQACRGDKYDDGQVVFVKKKKNPNIRQFPSGKGDGRDSKDGSDETDASTASPKDPSPQETPSPPKNVERQTSLSSSVDPPEYNQPRDNIDGKTGSDESEDEEGGKGTEADKTDAFGSSHKDIPVSPAPLYQDCLIMYATPPGHFAWRRKTGAWFIQCLCKLFDSNVLEHVSLHRGLSYVCGMVAREYQSENPNNPTMHHKKEVPVVESMLIKDVFMTQKRTDQIQKKK